MTETPTGTIDPVTRVMIQNTLALSADEMAMTIFRTSHSTIVRDSLDFSTSLCDAEGQAISQSVTIPLHMGAVPYAMRTLFQKYGEEMKPGDVFILNDPFDGGMHLPDIFVVKPIFYDDQRVAFSLTTAHHLDVGGRLPGSAACDNTEIFQEGLRIPWLKLFKEGEPNEAVWTLLEANIRMPEMTLGDLRAQIAACHVGERAICDLIGRYGIETFVRCARDLIDYTERLVRRRIAALPNGKSTFVDHLDSDGCEVRPVKIQVTITIEGDTITADFTGSSPQVQGGINCTESFTASAVALCVRSILREEMPNNAGMFRPIKIIAPKGTIVNAEMPAASSMRGVLGFRVIDAVLGAFADIVPDRIPAAGEGGNSIVIIAGKREDQAQYIFFELVNGTWGARPESDGNDGLTNPASVGSNIPVEQVECEYPLLIERYGLVKDSGGPGRFRGGMAIERQWHLLKDQANLSVRSDRRHHPPYGLSGGMPGQPSDLVLHSDGSERQLPGMVTTTMKAGDRLYHRIAGGGGWGDPVDRPIEKVVEDIQQDRVSIEAAREHYGVVWDPTTNKLDRKATQALRDNKRKVCS